MGGDPGIAQGVLVLFAEDSGSGTALVGEAWTVATADQKWCAPSQLGSLRFHPLARMRSKTALVARREEYGCVEAPWIVERGGYFYLFYSGSMVNWPL